MNSKHDNHKMENIEPISLLESLSMADTVSPDWSDIYSWYFHYF